MKRGLRTASFPLGWMWRREEWRGVSLRPPKWGHRENRDIDSPKKETAVARPVVAVRNWFIEQVTAIQSVARPLHVGPSQR